MSEHVVTARVRWADIDQMGVVYWAAYPRFMEIGELELFRHLGLPYNSIFARFAVWLVRRHVEIEYRSSALMDELLTIRTTIEKVGRSSVLLAFSIDGEDGRRCVDARLTLVCIRDEARGKPASLPPELAAILRDAA